MLFEVAKTAEIPEGEARRFVVDRIEIAVVNLGEGRYFALDDICSHADGEALGHAGDVGKGALARVSRRDAKIAAHQHDRNRRADAPHLANERAAGHAGHALVGEQGIEALWVGTEGGKGGDTGGEADRRVAKALERLGGKAHQRLFIVHHQDALPGAARQRPILVGNLGGRIAASGQIHGESAALAELCGDVNGAAEICHDAVHE